MNCYFFGTFNPVHKGHLKIANAVMKQFSFDKVIFVPSYFPPHKITADFKDRVNMLKLCGVEVLQIEKEIEPPNYTYKTVEKLGKCHFIIGYDAFFELDTWKNPEYLKKMLHFIVIARGGMRDKKEFEKMRDKGYNFIVADFEPVEISSRNIRLKFKNSQTIKNLVTKKVEDYINERNLY